MDGGRQGEKEVKGIEGVKEQRKEQRKGGKDTHSGKVQVLFCARHNVHQMRCLHVHLVPIEISVM